MLIVMKFGGTSVGDGGRIRQAARLAVATLRAGHRVVVVTSAMGGVTNDLTDAARAASRGEWDPARRTRVFDRHAAAAESLPAEGGVRGRAVERVNRELDRFEKLCYGLSMVHELTPRLLDAITGTGELLCAPLLAGAVEALGVSSEAVDATEVVVTDDQFGAAEPLDDPTRDRALTRLLPLVDAGGIPVVTGFIGATEDGVLTTLGRGGSDYSAAVVGAALDADEVWIWTDVNGVMTANPSEVADARTLREISYTEAAELAYYGAKVLHHKTILPAVRRSIPLRILNSFAPDDPGTRVSADGRPAPGGVKAVTSIRNVSLVSISGRGMQGIPGIAARTFEAVAAERANVLMISQASSENNICLVVNTAEAGRVVRALRGRLEFDMLKGHVDDVAADDSIAIVAAVGDKMKGAPGIAAKVFGALGAAGVNVIAISQGSSELNISLVVSEADAADAVRAIHNAFALGAPGRDANSH